MKRFLLVACILNVLGCGFEVAPPLDSGFDDSSYKVIYGEDSIREVSDQDSDAANSVALMSKENYEAWRQNLVYSVTEGTGLSSLAWFHQPMAAFCSGVLLNSRQVLTAGHCVDMVPCSNLVIVQGYELGAPTAKVKSLCGSIKKSKIRLFEEGLDYAVLNLTDELAFTEMKILKDQVPQSFDLKAYGYPMGVPLKVASGKIKEFLDKPLLFRTDLDVFQGNSGSPIFAAGELVGILSSGVEDFVQNPHTGMPNLNYCDDASDCAGEFVVPIQKILADLRK